MTHYVVFTIGPDGQLWAVQDLWAASPADAVEQAKAMLGRFDLEVWCKGRWITTLSANAAPRDDDIDGPVPEGPPSHNGAGDSSAGSAAGSGLP